MKLLQITLALCLTINCPLVVNGQIEHPPTPATDNSAASPQAQTELDLPVDESIKVTVSPVQVSHVVDHVMEPCTVTVRCPGALSAQVFLVPVDAPYGGKPLDRPRLIGSDNNPTDGLTIRWASRENSRYVKVFAVVHKKTAPLQAVRSLTIDLGIAGTRFDPRN